VVAAAFPVAKIRAVLEATGKTSTRQRDLPAHVVMYYVIALSLFMQVSCREVLRCLLDGLRWLKFGGRTVSVAGDSAISQARSRLGAEPVRCLHDEIVVPIATAETKGAWYRGGKLVSLDGSPLDVADSEATARAFGRPPASRGSSAFPQIRFVSLVENGTHVLFGSVWGAYAVQEGELAEGLFRRLHKGMLCLADRYYFSYKRWQTAPATEADLLWRVRTNLRLPVLKRFPDGSYLSKIYPTEKDRRHETNGIIVRAVDYRLKGVPKAEPRYRVITTILDPEEAPAPELAALYHERWEIETAFDELKTHLRGNRIVLRSKTPELVIQEFYGLLMAHYAVRGLMHEAALKGGVDPDTLSFVHAVRVVRRKLPLVHALSPSGHEAVP
jgi:hypothetical protein